MADIVNIFEVKDHLRLDPDATDNDALLDVYIAAATRACTIRIGLALDDPAFNQDNLPIVAQAVLLIVAGWWANREAMTSDARSAPAEIPLSATWLLEMISRRVLA